MDALLPNLLSLVNQYLTRNIDTGDKVFDASVLAILSLLVTFVIKTAFELFTSTSTLNWIVYQWYYYVRNKRDPLDFNPEKYKYDPKEIKNYTSVYLYSDSADIIKFLSTRTQTSVVVNTSESPNLGSVSVKNSKVDTASGVYKYPVYFDGTSMILTSCCAGNAKSGYIYGKDIMSLSRFIAYVKLRMQQREEPQSDSESSERGIYEINFGLINSIDTSLSLKLNFKYIGRISDRKIFDNIYYDQKPQLLNLLHKFQSGNMYPKGITMDNKLGILLYGPPGTGKTGTISAIANMLGRSVLMINFSKITKRSQLDSILNQELYSKLVYVFDEFDCILDVLVGSKQQAREPVKKQVDWTKILKVTEKDERKEIMDMMMKEIKETQEDDEIDLAYLLQKLDGLENADDRLIVATTNHPELINPVLLRPGRFDIKLELGNCSTQMYIDILSGFFAGHHDPECAHTRELISKANLVHKRWSPLQVINTALVCGTLEKTLQQLSKPCDTDHCNAQ